MKRKLGWKRKSPRCKGGVAYVVLAKVIGSLYLPILTHTRHMGDQSRERTRVFPGGRGGGQRWPARLGLGVALVLELVHGAVQPACSVQQFRTTLRSVRGLADLYYIKGREIRHTRHTEACSIQSFRSTVTRVLAVLYYNKDRESRHTKYTKPVRYNHSAIQIDF